MFGMRGHFLVVISLEKPSGLVKHNEAVTPLAEIRQ